MKNKKRSCSLKWDNVTRKLKQIASKKGIDLSKIVIVPKEDEV